MRRRRVDRQPPRGAAIAGGAIAVVAVIASLLGAWTGAQASPVRVAFPAAAQADYQVGGAYPPPAGVRIVDRDSGARPVPGRYNICYVNAYQAQVAQVGWWRRHHPDLLLRDAQGRLIIDPGWGEPLLDVGTAAKRAALSQIVGRWFDGCARHGFQAVEPDNLDSYTRSEGRLTLADDLAFAALLARRAHADGLDIAQKNLAEDSARVHALGYDFAIAEQCQQYDECAAYQAAYGRRVIDIEYERRAFDAACRAHAGQYSILLRDLDVVARGTPGYIDARC